ncbi:alpha/beta hydrolase [Paraflavitalea pollutisoli]|uniref:alpha/beta hydrolase n=1 Tax=Paraflavitalea pollutisoli TaxID=3034143 RepID=UPI0023ED109F|nr:alpha/beta fold hydrolase [Paraflavitalea sp. H1-2-19X]
MKKFTTLCFFLLTMTLISVAQFDDKFYFPSKTVRPIDSSLNAEWITLRTDTVSLSGLFLKPAGKPKATILFCHGAGGNISTYIFMTRPLVQAGYQVLMTDFRGYGHSTGTPTHLNIAKDGQLFFDYLLKRPEVKDTRLIVFGASIGTQIATKLTHDNAARVSALVLDGPMSSFTDIAIHYAPKEQHAMIKMGLVSPYSAKTDITQIGNIPVLVVASKGDKEVPFYQSEVVYEAAPAAKSIWDYNGAHLEAMKINPVEYVKRIDALLK